MQEGGALLGQGSFGCTFYPAPPCAGGAVFHKIEGLDSVGKLTADEDDPAHELGIGKDIMKLPMAKQYFALPTTTCKTDDPSVIPEASSCRFLGKSGKGTKFSLLMMPAAGQQLLKWSQDLPRMAEHFERIFRHLLEGMVMYQQAGFIHNDIHLGNILVDNHGVARYIDFGLGFRLSDIHTWGDTNMGKRFRPKYSWTPPEVHARRMYLSDIALTDGLTQLQEINPEYLRMEKYFPARKRAYDALKSFLEAAPSSGGAFIHKYAKKFDCWRIGLCMFVLWDDLMHEGVSVPNIATLRRVISGLTEFDPRVRLSAGQALYLLDPHSRFSEPTTTTTS